MARAYGSSGSTRACTGRPHHGEDLQFVPSIGIDTEHRTELVDSGLFGISRNPIFLALRVTQLGFLLTLPNVLMLVAVVMGEVSMQIQVRLEEEHLRGMHGEAYEAYSRKVRRWL